MEDDLAKQAWSLIDRYVELQMNHVSFIGTTDYKGLAENDRKIIDLTRKIDDFLYENLKDNS